MSLVLIGLRYQLVSIFTNDPEVIAIAIVLILFIAVYQTIDDAQAVIIGALRGYKDTTVPMIFGLVGYWFLALPIGYLLAEGLITERTTKSIWLLGWNCFRHVYCGDLCWHQAQTYQRQQRENSPVVCHQGLKRKFAQTTCGKQL